MKPGPDKQFDPETALAAAIEVFRERGYEGASLSRLTAEMGIGKKSLYDTFGNKRELFLRAIRHYGDQAVLMFQGKIAEEKSPMKGLRALFRTLERVSSEPCSKGCMIAANLGDFDQEDKDVAEVLAKLLKKQEDVLRKHLERAKEAGELDSRVQPRAAARLLVSLAQGTSLIGRFTVGSEPARSAYSEALRYLQKA